MKMNKENKEFTCIKCQHKWTSRTDKPLSCPRCKSYGWEKKDGN